MSDVRERWERELREAANPEKIEILNRFFKTGKGEYGEGDIFIGLTVPANRAISKNYAFQPLEEIEMMIDSPIHEFRLAGLLALVERYKKTRRQADRDEIVDFYLSIGHKANNWDLVDLSAPGILGPELSAGRRIDEIDRLIESDCLWCNRIAMVSMLNPVMKHGQTDLALATANRLLDHTHDLMRKAVGWVLREVGKKDDAALRSFLDSNIARLSSITLSYATEKFTSDPPPRGNRLCVFGELAAGETVSGRCDGDYLP